MQHLDLQVIEQGHEWIERASVCGCVPFSPRSVQRRELTSAFRLAGAVVVVGDEVMTYAPGQSLVTRVDLPVISNVIDASRAGGMVGYESSSQFSREYSRLFGEPPQRDIKRMRLQ